MEMQLEYDSNVEFDTKTGEAFISELSHNEDAQETFGYLVNKVAMHAIAKCDIFKTNCFESIFNRNNLCDEVGNRVFTFSDRYSEKVSQAIMLDTSTAGKSTAGEP